MDGMAESERSAQALDEEGFGAGGHYSAHGLNYASAYLRPLPRSTRFSASLPPGSKPFPTTNPLPAWTGQRPRALIEALLDEQGRVPTILMVKPGLAYLDNHPFDCRQGNGAADRRLQTSAANTRW